MTDQPKPNQPPATPNTAETKQPSKETLPTSDKIPVPPAKSTDSESKSEKQPDVTRPVEPPKPLGDAKPIVPEIKPQAAPTNPPTVPTQPSSTTSSAPTPANVPPKPASIHSPDAPTVPSRPTVPTEKPAATSKPVPPAKPAAPSEPVPPTKPNPVQTGSSNTTMPMPPNPTVPTSGKPTAPHVPDKEDTIPPTSNGTKVTQRFTDPSPAAQTSPGTICPNCGHRNRPGTLICDNCGTSLISGTKSTVGTRDLVSATEAAATASQPLLDQAQLNAVESAGGSIFSDDMVLRIEIEGGATPMLVYPKQEIILGRRDPNTGTLPDVDMTAYSGYRMGVSRTHASIRLQDKQLNLSDRGSSNGTFLNGTRLVAHRPYPIKDGDEIRLGQMVLKIYFQSNKGRK